MNLGVFDDQSCPWGVGPDGLTGRIKFSQTFYAIKTTPNLIDKIFRGGLMGHSTVLKLLDGEGTQILRVGSQKRSPRTTRRAWNEMSYFCPHVDLEVCIKFSKIRLLNDTAYSRPPGVQV